ncbi:hypothetical protein [Streptomyces sp. cg35]|uniref:hypothetical protein n=1 Tax=Streptomyces sp. cg35 TaxID=3421650 RepID=UPI003D17C88F
MSLFTPKYPTSPTPGATALPQKPQSAGSTPQAQPTPSPGTGGTTQAQRESSEKYRQRKAAREARRKQVVSAGTMRRKGRTVVLEGDWQLATDKVPTGNLKDQVFRGKVGDLTVKDFHALATNHGPNCRCPLSR